MQQLDIDQKQAAAKSDNNIQYMVELADGRMENRTVGGVQYIAGKAYFNRNNRWVESQLLEKENEKADREIEFGSDDYFKLADQLAKEGRQAVLAQGTNVLLQVGTERVLVRTP